MGDGMGCGLTSVKRNWIPNFRWVSCVVISLGLWASVHAQSPSPAPSAGEKQKPAAEKPKEANDRTGIMSRGTETAPLVVRIAEPPVIKVSPEEHTRQAESKAAEWSTAVIAFFALGVAGWQLYYFSKQLGIMNVTLADAATAATTAERAAKATEASVDAMKKSDESQLRAYVAIEVPGGEKFDSTDPFIFGFTCVNHGRTPAKQVGVRANFAVMKHPLDDHPALVEIERDWSKDRLVLFPISPESAPGHIDYDFGKELFPDDLREIYAGRRSLFIGIEIEYTDVFDHRQTTQRYVCLSGKSIMTIPGGSRMT